MIVNHCLVALCNELFEKCVEDIKSKDYYEPINDNLTN